MTFHSLRFDRAASTYGAHSAIQQRMAEILIGLIPPPEVAPMPGSAVTGEASTHFGALEMGCGTGLFTQRLRARFPGSVLYATDASPRMLDTARKNSIPAESPARATGTLPPIPVPQWEIFEASGGSPAPRAILAAAPFDLAASSAMVQWFPDLALHFTMVASLLRPGGSYLVSGFSRDNFPELNAILREPPFGYASFPGHFPEEVAAAAKAAGLETAMTMVENVETELPSAQAFLDSIRGLGSARKPEGGSPLTRSRLRHLLDTYQERYASAGSPGGEAAASASGAVKATWKPWYARLRKPG